MSRRERIDPLQPTLFTLHQCIAEACLKEQTPLERMRGSTEECLQALFDAADLDLEAQNNGRKHGQPAHMMVASFQVERAVKAQLDEICRQNGTTASAFLRQCSTRIVAEYLGVD
jgi:hypothetical protein